MSDKENTAAVSQADAATPQTTAAPTVPIISSQSHDITIINQINMQGNAPARRGNHGGGQRRTPRGTGSPTHTPVSNNRNGPPSASSPPSNPHSPASTASPTLESRGGHHYMDHVNGDERHTLTDRDGSRVVIVRDSDTGHSRLTFDDTRVRFTTESDEAGLEGQRRLPSGYGGIRNVQMDVSPSATFNSATIYCADNVSPISFSQWGIPSFDLDTTTTTNQRVGQLTVREIQEFTRRNPELGAELRSMRFRDGTPVAVTEVDGRTLTAAALNQLTPPRAQACPTGRDDAYTGIVPRR